MFHTRLFDWLCWIIFISNQTWKLQSSGTWWTTLRNSLMFFQLIKQHKRSRSSSLAKAAEQRIQVFQGVHTFFSDPGNNNSCTVNLDPLYCREPVYCGKASSFEKHLQEHLVWFVCCVPRYFKQLDTCMFDNNNTNTNTTTDSTTKALVFSTNSR